MELISEFKENLFTINEHCFEDSSLELFNYQYHSNKIYKAYCDSIKKTPTEVKKLLDIPFLPIEFYKTQRITTTSKPAQKIFQSSGTTSGNRSKHYMQDLHFYHKVSLEIFEDVFGSLSSYQILALLPSYEEQGDSSLISMVDHFMQYSAASSGYYSPFELAPLLDNETKKIVFGVSYALLDLPKMRASNVCVIETGGMKGRRKEMTRAELHINLLDTFSISSIWSEYGMTELTSQAYGENGQFRFPNWAKVVIRDINDPFTYLNFGKTGGINIIDLANIESCAFIETKDIGVMSENNNFEVLGRFDNSDIRGCNLRVRGE